MRTPSVALIHSRLQIIFPEGSEHRNYLIREMSAKTIFVMLYAGALAGSDRWIRPNQVCRMSDVEAGQLDESNRDRWYIDSAKPGYKPLGKPWYADNSREPIRDETLGEGLIPVRAVIERPGLPTTSSKGKYSLEVEFATLFNPDLSNEQFEAIAKEWRITHLSKIALARQTLIANGTLISEDAIPITFPNGEYRLLKAGPSSIISKAVIEEFAPRFLKNPQVLWLSESGNKVIARDEGLAASLGLHINPALTLPDIILVDLGHDIAGADMMFVFTEVVATDGPINRQRKEALSKIAKEAGFEESHMAFLTAFMDRSTSQFKKAIVDIAWNTYVWLVAEPDHIIELHDNTERKLSELR